MSFSFDQEDAIVLLRLAKDQITPLISVMGGFEQRQAARDLIERIDRVLGIPVEPEKIPVLSREQWHAINWMHLEDMTKILEAQRMEQPAWPPLPLREFLTDAFRSGKIPTSALDPFITPTPQENE